VHGTRLPAYEITRESAQHLVASLGEANEAFALRLAKRVFGRIALRYSILKVQFPRLREQAKNEEPKQLSDLECFARALDGKLSHDPNGPRKILKQASELHKKLLGMSDHVFTKLGPIDPNASSIDIEADILRHLLDYKIEEWKEFKCSLVGGGIDILTDDYRNLTDFIFGHHKQTLQEHIENFGVLFLTLEETANLQKDREAGKLDLPDWVEEVVRPRIEPIWYFVVALCRLLQHGENTLTATDAYWLGLVDEVIGQKLISLRLIAENPNT
jgi:hypothetical protein